MNEDLMVLAEFQVQCYRKVMQYIENGEKHISILMSVGSGKKTISYCLCKVLSEKRRFCMWQNKSRLL